MKKILVIVSRVPYPLEKGDKLRAFNQIKVLSTRYEVELFALDDPSARSSTKAVEVLG
ncbi:MAG TPA: sugar transferase, partial [Flavobacteriales bacterium]|nr:sugar transferase [Flavobacteriales bacterium]